MKQNLLLLHGASLLSAMEGAGKLVDEDLARHLKKKGRTLLDKSLTVNI